MEFRFLEVDKDDKELLNKVFQFRYKVFLEIFPEYLENSKCNNNIEYDKYDQYSTHFVAIDEFNEVCATVRLVYNSPIGYPAENSAKFDNSRYERNKLGEMSRIFIDKKYRNLKTTKDIINNLKDLMYVRMMKEGVEYTYGLLEANFLRLLKIYKLNYHTIGEEQTIKCLGLRYPSILYTDEFAKDNPQLIELWERYKKNV